MAAAHLGGKVLLLLGGASARKSGLHSRVAGSMAKAGVTYEELWGVAPNPSIVFARDGVRLCREKGISGILAIGGGSVIDCAKAIAAAVRHEGDPWDLFEKKIKPHNPLPLGALLTLAATGSESNGNSVMSNPKTEQKFAYYHPGLYPAFSILDPELTYTVPPDQTAFGAVDILSHVYEQFFHGLEGTDLQDGMAISIMRAVIKYAPVAVAEPDNYIARANLMWGSSLALNGLIGAGTVGDWTCHMLEHELSAKHGLAHGAGLAVVFPSWMRHVASRKEGRFRLFLEKVWDISTAGKSAQELGPMAQEALNGFHGALGIGSRIGDYCQEKPRITSMVDSLLSYKSPENLGGLTRNELISIYEGAV